MNMSINKKRVLRFQRVRYIRSIPVDEIVAVFVLYGRSRTVVRAFKARVDNSRNGATSASNHYHFYNLSDPEVNDYMCYPLALSYRKMGFVARIKDLTKREKVILFTFLLENACQ